MIDKTKLRAAVEDAIKGKGVFVTDITVSPDNDIVVEIDSADGVDLDTCADITRKIEAELPSRDEEDYSLEVGSAGITAPFKVVEQYTKNLGKEVEVFHKRRPKSHRRAYRSRRRHIVVHHIRAHKREGAWGKASDSAGRTRAFQDGRLQAGETRFQV